MNFVRLNVFFESDQADELRNLGIDFEDDGEESEIFINPSNISYINYLHEEGKTIIMFNAGCFVKYKGTPWELIEALND